MTAPARLPALPAALRRAVDEWVARGCAVEIRPDGTLRVEPVKPPADGDPFDMVDMRR